jgi:ubiquinone biosynthesis protein
MRHALAELGPTFVKMGQILSTRPDLLPLHLVRELAKLQDEVPAFPFPEVRRIIEAEVGAPLEEVFDRFDPEPLAAASVGQVHRALRAGAELVVKVQRPGLRDAFALDVLILLRLARLLESRLESWDIHRPSRVVEEFAGSLETELDFTVEAASMERFARCFAGDPMVRTPRVDWELTTPRLLTMEYLAGVKVSDLEGLAREGLDCKEIARRGAELIVRQVFVHGFFHGDPHPGNLRILRGNVICLLDFGVVGEISERDREDVAGFLLGLLRRDEPTAARRLARLAGTGSPPDWEALERDLRELRGGTLGRPLGEAAFGPLLGKILSIAATHRLTVPPRFFLLLKSLAAVDGLGRLLDPGFSVMRHVAPFVGRLRPERQDSRQRAEEIFEAGAEALLWLRQAPGQMRELISGLESGRLTVRLDRADRDRLAVAAAAYDRLSGALVLGSLIVGGCLLAGLGAPAPLWYGAPAAAWASWALAALLALRARRLQ